MEDIIFFFVSAFILDFVIMLSVKTVFSLTANFLYLIFLQVFNILNYVIYIFCSLEFYQFLLIKICVMFIITLLISDELKAKKIFIIFMSFFIFSFAIFGVSVFLTEFLNAVIFEMFDANFPIFYDFLLLFCLFLTIFAIFSFSRNLSNQKFIKNFLSKVSFSIGQKHIEITGLLDSGNTLYDTKSGLAVVVVSTKVLKNYLSDFEYSKICKGDFGLLGVTNFVEFVTVGESQSFMPVISDVKIVVSNCGESKTFECAIGFVNQNFGNNKYQCLLHKDFF